MFPSLMEHFPLNRRGLSYIYSRHIQINSPLTHVVIDKLNVLNSDEKTLEGQWLPLNTQTIRTGGEAEESFWHGQPSRLLLT